jgi:hypothetical protein
MRDEARVLAHSLLERGKHERLDEAVRALLYLEAGKALYFARDLETAENLFTIAAARFKALGDDSHYARAISNLGFIRLRSPSKDGQAAGLALIGKASNIKASIGDREGLGTNFSQLGQYYQRISRFQLSAVMRS